MQRKAKKPKPENCDGKDSGCDGEVDDGAVAGTGDTCNTGEPGACSQGVRQCIAGGIKCMADHVLTVRSATEIDDDCDGEVDEDCISEEEAREIGVLK